MRACRPAAVIHLAGLIEVGRSTQAPDEFWDVNLAGTLSVLSAMRAEGVPQLLFASSAAASDPQSPYARTKLAAELAIEDHSRAFGLRAVAFRFFNVAGAHPSGLIGENHDPETHIIPLAIHAALGGEPLTLNGSGDSERDYIHVEDIARAHVLALSADLEGFEVIELGSGVGRTVRGVIAEVERQAGPVPISHGPPRVGDPQSLVADPSKAERLLGWRPERSDLATIVADALRWERKRRGLP
jgi:UDP-glucose 4-epimerase